jgi:hypothetical protein
MTRSDVMTTMCPDGSYCCGFNNTKCCEKQAGYWVRNKRVFNYSGFPESESSESSTYIMDTPPGGSGMSQKLKISLAIGLSLGLVILLLLCSNLYFFIGRRRRLKNEVTMESNPNATVHQLHPMGDDKRPVELEPLTPELEETRLVELDSSPKEVITTTSEAVKAT